MIYPTMDQVNAADRVQICRWIRFLPSPGRTAFGKDNFPKMANEEGLIMDRICERFKEFGGFTPQISKQIGW